MSQLDAQLMNANVLQQLDSVDPRQKFPDAFQVNDSRQQHLVVSRQVTKVTHSVISMHVSQDCCST